MLTLFLCVFLATQTSGSVYHVSANGEDAFTCTEDICNIHCDRIGNSQKTPLSFDCSTATECNFYCEAKLCAQDAHILAHNSSNLHITVGPYGEECMRNAMIETPNNGQATLDMGDSKRGLRGIQVYAGSNTKEIIITAETNKIAGDDCKEMQIYGATAQYIEISIGIGIEWENGVLECPVPASHMAEEPNCVIHGYNALIMNTQFIAQGGTPQNLWIEPETIFIGTNTLLCNVGSDGQRAVSIAPFDTDSKCWFASPSQHSTTFYPQTTAFMETDNTLESTVVVTEYNNTAAIDTEKLMENVSLNNDIIIGILISFLGCCGCFLSYYICRNHFRQSKGKRDAKKVNMPSYKPEIQSKPQKLTKPKTLTNVKLPSRSMNSNMEIISPSANSDNSRNYSHSASRTNGESVHGSPMNKPQRSQSHQYKPALHVLNQNTQFRNQRQRHVSQQMSQQMPQQMYNHSNHNAQSYFQINMSHTPVLRQSSSMHNINARKVHKHKHNTSAMMPPLPPPPTPPVEPVQVTHVSHIKPVHSMPVMPALPPPPPPPTHSVLISEMNEQSESSYSEQSDTYEMDNNGTDSMCMMHAKNKQTLIYGSAFDENKESDMGGLPDMSGVSFKLDEFKLMNDSVFSLTSNQSTKTVIVKNMEKNQSHVTDSSVYETDPESD